MKTIVTFKLRLSVLMLALAAGDFSTSYAGYTEAAAYYAGGEADATPSAGGDVITAVDSINGNNMSVAAGAPTWSTNVAPSAYLQPSDLTAPQTLGFGGPSSFSYNFDGNSYLSTTQSSDPDTSYVAMEAWVDPSSSTGPTGTQVIFLNGNGSTNGYGLAIAPGTGGQDYQVLLGDNGLIDTGITAVPGVWTEFAYVNFAGTSDLYINGALISGPSGFSYAINNPTGGMSLGSDQAGNYFEGNIDEARLVYLYDGFNAATDLNYVTPVPEPGAWGMLGGLGALGLAVIRKRR